MDKPETSVEDRYDIETAVMFAPGEHMDVAAVAASVQPWWNRTLSAVNDAVVRLGVLEGDFHWHKHDEEDEFFYVVEGQLDIELEDRMPSVPGASASRASPSLACVMHFPHAPAAAPWC